MSSTTFPTTCINCLWLWRDMGTRGEVRFSPTEARLHRRDAELESSTE
jgi:hypothetical protein